MESVVEASDSICCIIIYKQYGIYVNQLSKNIAYESNVGYTCLSQRIKMQILKDAYLKSLGRVDEAVWEFYRSDITGRVGASKQLLDFLEKYGILYIINE